MGCGGTEEKKAEEVKVDEEGGDDHVSLHLTFGLQEGKTIDDFKTLYAAEVECLNKVEGCLHFQCEVTEEALADNTCLLTEKYASAAAHLAANQALKAAGLVEGENGIFATYNFVNMKFGLSAANYNDDYKGLLAGFKEATTHEPEVIVHDLQNAKITGTPTSEPTPDDTSHIVMTATVGLQEGKTFDDMRALYAKEVEVAKKCGGCLHFQLEMNDESAAAGTAVLHETYTGWAGHIELNKMLDEAGLVKGEDGIFATYKFNHFAFSLAESEYSDEYKGLMSEFEGATGHAPVMHLHDFNGKVRKVRFPE